MFKNILNMAQSPWGNNGNSDGPNQGSGGERRPPNIDDLAAQFQDSLKKIFSGGTNVPGGKKPIFLFINHSSGHWWGISKE